MAEPAPSKDAAPEGHKRDGVRRTLDTAKSNDLVFAIVAHAGSGATQVASVLAEELTSAGYQPLKIKLSDLLGEAAVRHKLVAPELLKAAASLKRTTDYQDAGDALRKRFGKSIAVGLAVKAIFEQRTAAPRENGPLAFILDQLKHPHEVEALRDLYGKSFYLIGVVCDPTVRLERLKLKYKGEKPAALEKFMERDEASSDDGQNVRKTLHLSDFFVSNSGRKPEELSDDLSRFIDVIIGSGVKRPLPDERGMYAAWAASLRSACLSRQVGAAILDKNGELISTGTNDVPRFGGGLYEEGAEPDHRCFAFADKQSRGYCRNDQMKERIYTDLFEGLTDKLRPGVSAAEVRERIEKTRVRDLIEFSRAVHAEMDALLSLLRSGGRSPAGGTLYCRTYPCHSCARHIVASGIHEVVYIEPYHKSLARELHGDAMVDTTSRHDRPADRVGFRLFSGVAPRRFQQLFENRGELKEPNGLMKIRVGGAVSAAHVDPVFKKSFLELEAEISDRVKELEKETDVNG